MMNKSISSSSSSPKSPPKNDLKDSINIAPGDGGDGGAGGGGSGGGSGAGDGSGMDSSIFLTNEGGIKAPLFCCMIGVPLILSGKWMWGSVVLVVGLMLAVADVMEEYFEKQQLGESSLLQEQTLHHRPAQDILTELEALEHKTTNVEHDSEEEEKRFENKHSTNSTLRRRQPQPKNSTQNHHSSSSSSSTTSADRAKCLASLSALAKKNTNLKRKNNNNHNANHNTEAKTLPRYSQQAAFISLRLFPKDDNVVMAALSLLALVAKDPHVRRRNHNTYPNNDYCTLDLPIQAMRNGLERAQQQQQQQQSDEDIDEEQEEQLAAELQRKGCLFLGALADGAGTTTTTTSTDDLNTHTSLAVQIVHDHDGLTVILEAANWFRCHEEVVNWALWAVFILCYDNVPNQVRLVQLGGILTICTCLKNNPDSLEVNRHGVAILFDVLRQQQEGTRSARSDTPRIDPWEVRKVALAAGLHDVIRNAMVEFSDSIDIMMMGQEMLIGTGYRGEIPTFQQPIL
jgi:hypothetical protein